MLSRAPGDLTVGFPVRSLARGPFCGAVRGPSVRVGRWAGRRAERFVVTLRNEAEAQTSARRAERVCPAKESRRR